MKGLTLAQADRIADGTIAKGRELGLQPLTVAVLDAGGHAVVLKRDDGASIMRSELATAKAWGALGMGFGGRELARRAQKMPEFFAALNAISDGRMVPVAGSVLLRDADGHVVGAVGVSGDTSDNDEAALVPAVQATGLVPDTGDAPAA
ncbi:GlcG/HbpS family heme-binding protein [Bordetella genomosp. 13]|uniref:GlcG/HbpS family heme-binding protein n=1 Tax=Bordetella genomosp. 13 TaxID=463040 RepID=UPI00119E2A9E|nr:heme-binding protein [Bordetella genomosp. 13]